MLTLCPSAHCRDFFPLPLLLTLRVPPLAFSCSRACEQPLYTAETKFNR